MRAFRQQYPEGDNFVLARDVARAYSRSYGDFRVRFEDLASFAGSLAGWVGPGRFYSFHAPRNGCGAAGRERVAVGLGWKLSFVAVLSATLH